MDTVQSPQAGRAEDVRMKICLKLETGDGEQICEIDQEYFFQAILARSGLEKAESDFETSLYAMIVSPARGMFRGKVRQLQEKEGYVRLVLPGAPATSHNLFDNKEDLSAFMENIRRHTAAAGGVDNDNHGATAFAGDCVRQ